jgi:acyl-CoA dehydrogenase family protein 9
VTLAHPALEPYAEAVSEQVKSLRDVSESLLREHKRGIVEQGLHHKRLADSLADIYAQIAVLSRVSSIFEDQGVEPSGQERYIAGTFCTRAADRVRGRLERIDENDDDRMTAIAKLAYRRGEYGYALFED